MRSRSLRVAQHSGHDKKLSAIVRASFPDLPGIEDKILAEYGRFHGFSGVARFFNEPRKIPIR